MVDISRRTMMKAAGVIGAVGSMTILPLTVAPVGGSAQEPDAQKALSPESGVFCREPGAAQQQTYLFFNSEEAAFIEAAVARLIPKDDEWGGALEADVPNYIDKQLAGAWGAGERLYRSGPWQPGTPSQGYQLPFTPAELFRTALGAINKELSQRSFAQMTPDEQDGYLKTLEAGGKDLGGVPSDVFFSHLWESTLEGFFSDPVYGGNCNMVSWRMIGFPGAFASYYDLVDQHGIKINRPPMSLAEGPHGHVHVDPNIPASNPPGISPSIPLGIPTPSR
jgi:gluconate 2-dehydrogenase gamma chain